MFYPPFDSHLPGTPRSEDSRISYTALTHPRHDGQDEYAVDFNWDSGAADRGHSVLAAADGRVSATGDGGTTTPWAYDRSVRVEPLLA